MGTKQQSRMRPGLTPTDSPFPSSRHSTHLPLVCQFVCVYICLLNDCVARARIADVINQRNVTPTSACLITSPILISRFRFCRDKDSGSRTSLSDSFLSCRVLAEHCKHSLA
ncbi:hypothetical protein J6590_067937 [Homalodisca vitripennis]|nr:hypothetical protein J6590_067937 [Homalodisca vitripennis]